MKDTRGNKLSLPPDDCNPAFWLYAHINGKVKWHHYQLNLLNKSDKQDKQEEIDYHTKWLSHWSKIVKWIEKTKP